MKNQRKRTIWKVVTPITLIVSVVTAMATPLFALAYQAAPFVSTLSPTYITEKSAQLNGQVNPNEMSDTYQWFEWGISGNESVVYETTHNPMGASSQMASTQTTLIGLAPSTQYFYRQIAENSRGKQIGLTTYFTTKPLPSDVVPVVMVQTLTPGTVNEGNAILRGYISPNGNTSVTWWFQWGKTNKLENETSHGGWGGTSGQVQATISNLISGTPYYYRVVAQNALGVVYGTMNVLVTAGTPPPLEAPHDQNIPSPQAAATDGVPRTITSSGAIAPVSGSSGGSLPGFASTNRPGDIFGALFGGNKQNQASPQNTAQNNVSAPVAQTNNTDQVASVGASSPLGVFWNTLTGKKPVEVNIAKIGPTKVPAHTPVEYKITYAYRLGALASNAKLRITLPGNVVYIGDNTNNELLLEESAVPGASDGERTYQLPIGRLENGQTRTLSILGMTTGDADGTFPDAHARLEFVDGNGVTQVVAAAAPGNASNASSAMTAQAGASGGLLPSSLLGWILYIVFIVGSIFAIRKAKAYYEHRKEELALEEEQARRESESVPQFPAGQVPA